MPGGGGSTTNRFGAAVNTPASIEAAARQGIQTSLAGSPLTNWLSQERRNQITEILLPFYNVPGHSGHQYNIAPFWRASSPVLVAQKYLTEQEQINYLRINEASKNRSINPVERFVRGIFAAGTFGLSEVVIGSIENKDRQQSAENLQILADRQNVLNQSEAKKMADDLASKAISNAVAPDSASFLSELNQREQNLKTILAQERQAIPQPTNWQPVIYAVIVFAVVYLFLPSITGGKSK